MKKYNEVLLNILFLFKKWVLFRFFVYNWCFFNYIEILELFYVVFIKLVIKYIYELN